MPAKRTLQALMHIAHSYYMNPEPLTSADADDAADKRQTDLTQLDLQGTGVQARIPEVFEYFQTMAKQGNATAQFNLAAIYQQGELVTQDLGAAHSWYNRAAEQGMRDAQSALAHMYECGIGVNMDVATAVEWFRRAAEQGCLYAQNSLHRIYAFGQGVERDDAAAAHWQAMAAEQDGFHQLCMAMRYLDGYGVDCDNSEAGRRFVMAADQSEPVAQNVLKSAVEGGCNVEQDHTGTARWIRQEIDRRFKEFPDYDSASSDMRVHLLSMW